MTKREFIENNSILIFENISFCVKGTNNGSYYVVCRNLKRLSQVLYLRLTPEGMMFNESCTLSKANMYKSMFIVERNKKMFIKEIQKYQN